MRWIRCADQLGCVLSIMKLPKCPLLRIMLLETRLVSFIEILFTEILTLYSFASHLKL